ncbi:MAG: hypothetical protein CM15mP92_1580 [Halieaceae bacterium]|nr:MAG: hypothetical protein CM15mP92_1580 [Halieaceae bacterium]
MCPAKTSSGPDEPRVPRNYRPHQAQGLDCKPCLLQTRHHSDWQPASSGVTEAQAIKSRVSASVALVHQLLACSISFSSIALLLVRHCTAPVLECRLIKV